MKKVTTAVFFAAIIAFIFVIAGSGGSYAQTTAPNVEENDIGKYNMAKTQMQPIFVIFYSNDCPHCKQMAPIIENLKKKYGRTVVFTRFNAKLSRNGDFVLKNKIESVPTIQFIGKNGQMKDIIIGAVQEEEVENGLKLLTEGGTGTHIGQPLANNTFTKLDETKQVEDNTDPENPQADNVFAINANPDDLAKYNMALKAHKPMVVDYYTNWCGWCKKLEPTLNDAKRKWGGKVVFVRINAEQARFRSIVKKAGISGYPTLHFYGSDGRIKQTAHFLQKDELERELRKISN